MSGELVYPVRKGDTLEAIAKQYYGGQSAVARGIARYNRLSPGAALREGDSLKLPPRLFFPAGPPKGAKKPSSSPPVCFWLDFALRLVEIRLSDDELAPFAGKRYSLAVGEKTFEGTLTETGSLRVSLSAWRQVREAQDLAGRGRGCGRWRSQERGHAGHLGPLRGGGAGRRDEG